MAITMLDTLPDITAAHNYILSLDVSYIENKLVYHQHWLRKDAKKACEAYKKFLYLTKKYGEKIPLSPSIEIDEVWHCHILNTKQYRHDCQIIFGKYLDHTPVNPSPTENNASSYESFQNFLNLYQKEFNQTLYQLRSPFSTIRARLHRKVWREE